MHQLKIFFRHEEIDILLNKGVIVEYYHSKGGYSQFSLVVLN